MNRLALLGPIQITKDGAAVRGFESRKALALLCYLALRAQPTSRAELANLFWQAKTEAQGRANLSRVLNNLSSLFPNTLDIQKFQECAQEGTAEGLISAAALYRDEFMAGLFLDDCPDFEIWLVGERERWRQRVVSALECLSGYYARRGEYATALPFAARLLEIEPWREEAHRVMIDLLARTGQRSAALQQYETARRVLAEELNVEPSAETNVLYAQIRAEEIASPVTPTHNLPTQLTTFFGRETDLTRVAARLNNPDCRLLTLVGAGGIGKTRLALEAANHLLGSFRDGVYFVPLASIGAGQTDFIVPAIANALGFIFAGNDEPKTQLLNFLRAKRMLLLLDNFEHLLDGTTLVLEILQHAPNVKILITSREPLNAQAEWITRVGGLSYPTSVSHNAEELGRYSAVQLFVERANRVNENFSFDAETSASVNRICQIVEGRPLALELAAAASKWQRLEKIAEQIANNLDLMSPLQDVESRHQNLRAVLDWSYGLLSEAEQKLFRGLSVFAGGWTLEAAEQVCGEEGVETEHIAGLLNKLVDKSLVVREEREGETRYRMLEPVRQYAHEKLDEAGEANQRRDRHLGYFRVSAEQAEPKLKSAEQLVWLERLENEQDNLRAALDWSSGKGALGNVVMEGAQLAAALWHFWLIRGNFTEARRWLEQAVTNTEQHVGAASQQTARRARIRILHAAGEASMLQEDFPSARTRKFFHDVGYRASTNPLGVRAASRPQRNLHSHRIHHRRHGQALYAISIHTIYCVKCDASRFARRAARCALSTRHHARAMERRVGGKIFEAYHASFRDRPGFPDPSAEEWIRWQSDDPDFRPDLSWLASHEGQPVGFIVCAPGWISQVGVRPEWRGRGLGAALTAQMLQQTQREGGNEVLLDVNVNNPTATRVYARLGFVVVGRRGRYERKMERAS